MDFLKASFRAFALFGAIAVGTAPASAKAQEPPLERVQRTLRKLGENETARGTIDFARLEILFSGISFIPTRIDTKTGPFHVDHRDGAYFISDRKAVFYDPDSLRDMDDGLADFFFLHEAFGASGISDVDYGLTTLLYATARSPDTRFPDLGLFPASEVPTLMWFEVPIAQIQHFQRGGDGVRGGGDPIAWAIKAALVRHSLALRDSGRLTAEGWGRAIRVVAGTQVERNPFSARRGVTVADLPGLYYHANGIARPTLLWDEECLGANERIALLRERADVPDPDWLTVFSKLYLEEASNP